MAWNYLTLHGKDKATPIIRYYNNSLYKPRVVYTILYIQGGDQELHRPELWEGEEHVQRDHHSVLHPHDPHCNRTGEWRANFHQTVTVSGPFAEFLGTQF